MTIKIQKTNIRQSLNETKKLYQKKTMLTSIGENSLHSLYHDNMSTVISKFEPKSANNM